MVSQLIAPVGGMSTSISQYLQDSLAECVEHRLGDPLQFLFHHMRHLKLVLTSDVSSGATPTPHSALQRPSPLPAESVGSSTFQFFDRLHRYVFQHEGGRALRTCFFIFQRASDNSNSCSKLALRSAIFSCFTELFSVSQRLDHASLISGASLALPATELSRIPFRIALAFYFAVLEEQLMFLATPQVLLYHIMGVIEKSVNVISGQLTQAQKSRYMSALKSSLTWVKSSSPERATWMLKALVKVLEDTLRCGPMTIVTATTRKKKQETVPTVPAAVLAFTTLQNSVQSQVVDPLSTFLLPADEQSRDVLVAVLEDLCASPGNSASPTKSTSSRGGSSASPSPMRFHVDLATFEDHLMFMRLGVSILRQVALPLFALIESRCSVVSTESGAPGIMWAAFTECFSKLRETRPIRSIILKIIEQVSWLDKHKTGELSAKAVGDSLMASFEAANELDVMSLSHCVMVVDSGVLRLLA